MREPSVPGPSAPTSNNLRFLPSHSGSRMATRRREQQYQSFSQSRNYAPTQHGGRIQPYERPQTRRGRGRLAPMRQRPKVTKEVYLLGVGTKVMPRGLEKSKLYQNGQVKTAFKIDIHLNEMEFQELIEMNLRTC